MVLLTAFDFLEDILFCCCPNPTKTLVKNPHNDLLAKPRTDVYFTVSQDLRSNVVDMSLNYITEGNLPITTQKIDPTSGSMKVSLQAKGSQWKPQFEEDTWRNGRFELVSLMDPKQNRLQKANLKEVSLYKVVCKRKCHIVCIMNAFTPEFCRCYPLKETLFFVLSYHCWKKMFSL